jgi:RHS repeat-associated protein
VASAKSVSKTSSKEYQPDHGFNWYDYDFRFYDPAVCRFWSVDPLADKFPWWTTYQYAGNMPIKFIDLDGAEPYYRGTEVGEYQVAPKWGSNIEYGWTWCDFGNKKFDWMQSELYKYSIGDINKGSSFDNIKAGIDFIPFSLARGEQENLSVFASAFRTGMFIDGNREAFREGSILFDKFVSGDNRPISFSMFSQMSEYLSADPAFQKMATTFSSNAMAYYKTWNTLNGFVRKGLSTPYIKDTWFMHTVMGGTQQVDAQIMSMNSKRTSVRFTVWDRFGAGLDDATSKLPGLPSMSYLQHVVRNPNKYTPFIWNINVINIYNGK